MKLKLYYLVFFILILSCSDHKNENHTNKNYERAWELFETKKDIEAYRYFILSKNDFLSINDSLGAGKSLMNSSIILLNQGDYFGSDESNIQALKYFKESFDNEYILSIYNTIAIAKNNLKEYKTAIIWYEKALNLSEDSLDRSKIQNNIAVALSKNREYNKSIRMLEELLESQKFNPKKEITSKIIDNLAYTKFLQDSAYNALPELTQALQIREKENDLWGQNASHAHLSDYFFKKNKAKSLYHAQQMLAVASELQSPDDRLEAMQKLILLETPEKSKAYFQQYRKLDDSLQTARAKAKNQFALIRYETEKEKAENAKKQNHILKQNIAIGTLGISLLGFFVFYKKRRKQLQQKNEIEVKNTQLRYSKKVHDVVANGLYHTMVEIQNSTDLDKETVLNRIEKLYEESRDIARDDPGSTAETEFPARLFRMLNSYASDEQRVIVMGNEPENWANVSPHIQSEIFYVLREAMVNMKKHSQARLVSVIIENSEKKLSVRYSDNGLGIEDFQKKKKSGIRNMENRIAETNGHLTFEKNPKGGLIILITVPTL